MTAIDPGQLAYAENSDGDAERLPLARESRELGEFRRVAPLLRGFLPGLGALVIALSIAFTAVVLQSTRRSLADLDRRTAAVDAEWTDAARQVQAAMDLRQSQQNVAHQAECAQTMLETTPRSAVLADVTNALPTGSWLSSFSLDSVENDRTANVSIIGIAPGESAVSQFVAHLRQSNLLHDVKLASCDGDGSQGSPSCRFRIDMQAGDFDSSRPPAVQPTWTASIGH